MSWRSPGSWLFYRAKRSDLGRPGRCRAHPRLLGASYRCARGLRADAGLGSRVRFPSCRPAVREPTETVRNSSAVIMTTGIQPPDSAHVWCYGITSASGRGCVKTQIWPPEIDFKLPGFSVEVRCLLGFRYFTSSPSTPFHWVFEDELSRCTTQEFSHSLGRKRTFPTPEYVPIVLPIR